MSKKTQLIIEASAELFFGGYCSLALLAWFAKGFLFSNEQGTISPMLILWLGLTVASFILYGRTRRKMKALEAKEKAQEAKELESKELKAKEFETRELVSKELHSK